MKIIDACGRSCPEPVILTKQALTSKEAAYQVLVDNQTAVENVTRFASNSGYHVKVEQEQELFKLHLTK